MSGQFDVHRNPERNRRIPDVVVVQSIARLDFNTVLLPGANIFRSNLQNPICIDQEFHLDARQTCGSGRNAKREAGKRTAILGKFTFTL